MVDESAPNYPQRVRRKDFYMKNGFNETGLFLTYFGVTYEVLCRSSDFDTPMFKEMLLRLPIEDFNPVFFTQ